MWCAGAVIVLLMILPWRPKSTGVPYTRIQETAAVWIGYALLSWGMGRARSSVGSLAGDVPDAIRLRAGLNAASGAMCLTALATIVSLTSILVTTLEGAAFIALPYGRTQLYPSEFNYALVLPLGLALLCHVAVIAMQLPLDIAAKPPQVTSVARLFLLLVLGLLLAVFLLAALGAIADRWFVVGAVVVTWIASWVFLGVAIEQVTWSASLPLPGETPFGPR
jgi:hypothetical protein